MSGEAEKAGTLQSEEENAFRDLASVGERGRCAWVKKTEPDSAQWYCIQ